ncbi:MAG: D-alanyl-D-alanine carboxypeptidase [Proteobacteria bacterium]|nr:D-alanyl-D-alanine carboxypeptidase [Pseudomonadota bacterium]
MRKIILFLTFLSITLPAFAQEKDCSKDYSSLVIEEKTGAILYEKRSDKFSYPASLVKLMTLYLTFEALENKRLELNQVLTVSDRGEEIAKVNIVNTSRLKAGDKITVEQAIKAVIVKSFNEAAVTLSEAVASSEWEFVRKMNNKAEKLGMFNTSFRNVTGLHEEGQYTNSYDLARLALAIKKDFPQYYHFFALKKFTMNGQKYETHNYVLLDYKGAEGMKTGFTNASGFNLVSAAKKEEDRIISIVLGCSTAKSRDQLTKNLLDICFKKLQNEKSKNQLARFNILNLKGFDYCAKDENLEEDHKIITSNSD